MPPGREGDILLTTRIKECVTYETVGSTTLDVLKPELARELLLRATHTTQSKWKEKEKAATNVVKILGSHTLAIIQAGAYIRQNLSTLEQYPTIFQQQKEQLLKFHSKQNVSTYRNVYTTFEVSAEYLQNSKLPEDTDALCFLHTLAFMHNSGISEAIFERASEYALELRDTGTSNDEDVLSLSVRHVARLPEYAQQRWSSLQGRWRWRKACAILESLSIITMDNDGDSITISMHSLVHAWAKERQDDQTRWRAWQSAATILALSCEGEYNFCPIFIFLQPHVRACVSHEIEDYTQNMSEMEAAQQLFQFAYVLYTMKDESSLGSLVQRIRLRLQNRDGADQETVLQIKLFTGRVSLWQGNFGGAVDFFREIVESRAQALAEDHPSRLASQHELARAYRANGQVDEAVELLEHVVKVEAKLAEDHPSRLASQHELAGAYQANGQVDEAVELLEHVIKVQAKLAEDHPSRLASQHELAGAYQANGQVDEAELMYQRTLTGREKGQAGRKY
jgi:Tfp pilus assembly protein PilF